MKIPETPKTDFAMTAGLRLRCFLGRALGVLALCLAVCASSQAQLDIPKPMHITHVEGYVANTYGMPVVNAEVTLVQDEQVVYSTRTDADGAFRFDHARGHYQFRVARTAYAPAVLELTVTDELVTHLERRKLYVVVGPGACLDACSAVYTTEREYVKAIRKMPKGQAK
jgi:hypothetical protein